MGEGQTPHRSLDPCLQGILRGTPGEDRISRALALAHVCAIEQLEAIGASVLKRSAGPTSLGNRPEAEIVAETGAEIAGEPSPKLVVGHTKYLEDALAKISSRSRRLKLFEEVDLNIKKQFLRIFSNYLGNVLRSQ